LSFSTDGMEWTSIAPSRVGDVWSVTLPLMSGRLPENLSFVVQAVDGAGNVAYSSNKGASYSSARGMVYLPLVIKSD